MCLVTPQHSTYTITEARFISLVNLLSCIGKPRGALYGIRTLVLVVVAEATARDWAEEGAVVVRRLVRRGNVEA